MRLLDFESFEPIISLRRQMGADKLGSFEFFEPGTRLTNKERVTLEDQGIELDSIDELRVLDDETLAYKDSRVLLHIRDVKTYHGRVGKRDNLPKFHVSNCRTLQEMRMKNRFGRYVVATRDDGKFLINLQNAYRSWDEKLIELDVCKYCLAHLAFDGYSLKLSKHNRLRIFNAFTLKEFFSRYPKSPIKNRPAHSDRSAPLDEYPENWSELSKKYRESVGWKCEECGIDLSIRAYRKYLHVHHINSQRNDNRNSNLRAICIRDHAEQPDHGHLKLLPEYKEFEYIWQMLN